MLPALVRVSEVARGSPSPWTQIHLADGHAEGEEQQTRERHGKHRVRGRELLAEAARIERAARAITPPATVRLGSQRRIVRTSNRLAVRTFDELRRRTFAVPRHWSKLGSLQFASIQTDLLVTQSTLEQLRTAASRARCSRAAVVACRHKA